MTVCYIDVDDEITDAIGRIRAAEDKRMVVVLPPGSRISTSRINFRLLAREADRRDVTLAVVSGEPGVRALAISAGLPAHVSIEESEAALAAALQPRADTSTGWPFPESAQPVGSGPSPGVASFPDRRSSAGPVDASAAGAGLSGPSVARPGAGLAAAPGPSRQPAPAPPSPRIQVSERGATAGMLPPARPLPGHAPGDAEATRAFSVTPRAAASAAGAAPIATTPPAAWYDPAEEEARERRR